MHVDPYSARKIRESGLDLRVIQEKGVPCALKRDEDGELVTMRENGTCVFLRDDGLCRVHSELGIESKPLGCRQFPFMIRPTPDGIVVGVSFFCTAVQQNAGRPLEEHIGEIEAIVSGMRFHVLGDTPLRLFREQTMTWSAYRGMEEAFLDHLERSGLQVAAGQVLYALSRLIVMGDTGELDQELISACTDSDGFDNRMLSSAQVRFFVSALIGVRETPAGQDSRALIESIEAGREVCFPRFSWKGRISTIDIERYKVDFADEIDRYGRALVFRKFLVLKRDLYTNLALLYLVPELLGVYAGISAWRRGASLPSFEDHCFALDIIERDVLTHARGLDHLYDAFAEGFLQMFRF